jgi:hypothetical protein
LSKFWKIIHYLCQNFNKFKSSIVKIWTIDFDFPWQWLKTKQSRHTRLFHNIDKSLFIVLYNHYMLKISELKKLGAKVKISNLNNYLVVCCWNGKGSTIFIEMSSHTHTHTHLLLDNFLCFKYYVFPHSHMQISPLACNYPWKF